MRNNTEQEEQRAPVALGLFYRDPSIKLTQKHPPAKYAFFMYCLILLPRARVGYILWKSDFHMLVLSKCYLCSLV